MNWRRKREQARREMVRRGWLRRKERRPDSIWKSERMAAEKQRREERGGD